MTQRLGVHLFAAEDSWYHFPAIMRPRIGTWNFLHRIINGPEPSCFIVWVYVFLDAKPTQKWRNWQTRRIQNPVATKHIRFMPPHRHPPSRSYQTIFPDPTLKWYILAQWR